MYLSYAKTYPLKALLLSSGVGVSRVASSVTMKLPPAIVWRAGLDAEKTPQSPILRGVFFVRGALPWLTSWRFPTGRLRGFVVGVPQSPLCGGRGGRGGNAAAGGDSKHPETAGPLKQSCPLPMAGITHRCQGRGRSLSLLILPMPLAFSGATTIRSHTDFMSFLRRLSTHYLVVTLRASYLLEA